MQRGLGISGFQKFVANYAGYDGWISVIFAGGMSLIIMWFLFKLAEIGNGDLCEIHWTIYGKGIGNLFNIILAIYYVWYAITGLRNYIEVVQVWMFSDLSTFWFAISFLLLCIYIIYGGIRVIVGIAFFSLTLTLYIIYIQGYTIPFSDFNRFFPLFDHSFNEILKSFENMSFSTIGYETLLIFYPFIKSPTKTKKWAQLALIFTITLYLFITLITFAFFPEDELKTELWPTLSAYTVVKLPVVARFEFIGIANWCLIILPSICLSLWCSSRLLKRSFTFNMKYGVFIFSTLVLLGCVALKTKEDIAILNEIINNLGFFLDYMYIPLLLVLLCLALKIKAKRKS